MQLVYILHSGKLYGTERMSLATCEVLQEAYSPLVLAPPGDIHKECNERKIPSRSFSNISSLMGQVRKILKENRKVVFFVTSVRQALVIKALNVFYRRTIALIDVVHGGEPTSTPTFRNKRWYNYFNIHLVAPSRWMEKILIRDGVAPNKITRIDNFIPQDRMESVAKRGPFKEAISKGIMLSRLDPNKQVYLLFEAMELDPELKALRVDIYGSGDLDRYKEMAKSCPNIHFHGFQKEAADKLCSSDIFIHTCPTENIALVILEACIAGLPIVAPNGAGCGEFIEDGITGFLFNPGSAQSLGECIKKVQAMNPESLNKMVEKGRRRILEHYSPEQGALRYRALIERLL